MYNLSSSAFINDADDEDDDDDDNDGDTLMSLKYCRSKTYLWPLRDGRVPTVRAERLKAGCVRASGDQSR